MPQYCNIFKLVIIYLMKESTEEESNERGKENDIYGKVWIRFLFTICTSRLATRKYF